MPGTVDAAPSDPSRPADFRLLYVGSFIAYGDRFAIAPILVTVAADLQESLAAVTVMATLYFFLYGALQPVYGIVSDRVGRVRVMRIALLGMFLASAASAFAPTLITLIVTKATAAALAADVLPTSLVYVSDLVPLERRQHVIANVLAAGSVGTVLATVGAGLAAPLRDVAPGVPRPCADLPRAGAGPLPAA
jgi:MFS family permease